MNTFEELIANGINAQTAKEMLNSYRKKIGTMNGIYEITDITYDPNIRGKVVELTCTECGEKIYRTVISGKNKWSELIKSCTCQKKRKLNQQKEEAEKISKNKKAQMCELLGKTIGDYLVSAIEWDSENPFYKMRCTTCGSEIMTSARPEIFGRRKNFKCTKHYVPPIKYDDSYIGKKKNFLTVKGIVRGGTRSSRMFLCKCDCGNKKIVKPAFWNNGSVKSCGCCSRPTKLEHSEELDRLRRIRRGMIQRCYNKNNENYENYGKRGISICEEWLESQDTFIEWALQNGYANNLSIDRIDANGNYEPSNCRWADKYVQANNKRPSCEWNRQIKRTWTIDGETKSRKEWCEIYNIGLETALYRINHKGMSVIQALTAPKETDGRPRKKEEHENIG